MTGVALSRLLLRDLAAASAPRTHFAPKAKQVLQIFCPGGASHVDLWKHKQHSHRAQADRRFEMLTNRMS